MSGPLKRAAGMLYGGSRQRAGAGELPAPLQGRDFRYFSYGRYALLEGLTLAGVGKGDVVLLPEYICRENLAAIRVLGARAEYYPVNQALAPAVSPDSLPSARAIVAVNYFGFPQDLSPFQAYCARTGAILIEDNAHGFLSRDSDGTYLGMRGDIGIFSFRKTIALVNGSGLVINHAEKARPLSPQLPYVNYPESRSFRMKKDLRRLPEWHMTGLLYAIIGLDRAVRKLRTGADYVKSDAEAEQVLPGHPEPDARLPEILRSLDVDYEISRRRALYAETAKVVEQHGGKPVFLGLPANVVPYGYAFHATPDTIGAIKKALKSACLDCNQWPELPSEIESKAPGHYRSVWLVNFIW